MTCPDALATIGQDHARSSLPYPLRDLSDHRAQKTGMPVSIDGDRDYLDFAGGRNQGR